jgi:2-methylcitrate dehydratase PrpD
MALAALPCTSFATASRAQESPTAATASHEGELIKQLSQYMSAAGDRPLPEEAAEKTKHHVLDTFAAMFSGVELPPAQVALRFATQCSGERTATIVGTDVLCGPLEAAIINGMLAQSDETDDSHAPSHSHPGCGVIPAALAAGEQFAISGRRFLNAVTLGYDVGPRVTMALGGLPYQMKSHRSNHSIANTFGATAAAACAAGLNPDQMRWALSYAAQQASGITTWQRDTQHVEKSLVFGGMPARNGVTTALLIKLGGSGVDDVFSGPDNFFQSFGPNANTAMLTEAIGERYEVTRTNIKKWSVGSPIQAPLDALQAIIQKHPVRPNDVKSIVARVATSEAKTVNNREMPDICMQHLIAVMLLDKTVSFHAAHDKARMQDPAVLAVRAKVQLIPDEDLERLYPQRVAIVEMTLTDGTKLNERVAAVKGTAENPMTREEVVTKSRELMAPWLGAEKCNRLIETVLHIDAVKDIRELRPLLQRA